MTKSTQKGQIEAARPSPTDAPATVPPRGRPNSPTAKRPEQPHREAAFCQDRVVDLTPIGFVSSPRTEAALDAIDGTPVLDLKPHMAEFAPRGEVRQPAWSPS